MKKNLGHLKNVKKPHVLADTQYSLEFYLTLDAVTAWSDLIIDGYVGSSYKAVRASERSWLN